MQRHVMPVSGNVPSNGRHQLRIIDVIRHAYWRDDFHEAANFRLLCVHTMRRTRDMAITQLNIIN